MARSAWPPARRSPTTRYRRWTTTSKACRASCQRRSSRSTNSPAWCGSDTDWRGAPAMPSIRTEARATIQGYGPVAKSLHWLVLALLIAQYVFAFTMPDIGRNTVPGTLINLHMSFGLTILAVVVVRWLWRRGQPIPLATRDLPPWERPVARIVHGA